MILIVILNGYLLSNNIPFSKSKDEIVINVPQNSVVIKKENFESRFNDGKEAIKLRTQLPRMFTIIIFE